MKNISDHELDDLFRKQPTNERIEFKPDHWRDLEGKLDVYYSKREYASKIIFTFFVLIFSLGSLFIPSKLNVTELGEKELLDGSVLTMSRVQDNNSGKNKSFYHNSFKNLYHEESNTGGKNYSKKLNEVGAKRENQSSIALSSFRKDLVALPPINYLTPKSCNNLNFTNVHVMQELKKRQSQAHSYKGSKNEDYYSYRNMARISVLVSPDLSSSSGIGKMNSGYNTGIMLEYFPLYNLSIATGILKSKKVYDEKPEANKSGYSYSKDLKNIFGDCSVTDIPINIRYFYLSNYRFKGFVSAGVSSYLMRKEDYTYQYSNYEKTYNYRKQNNHLFSVVNLSLGADFQLGKNFSLGIEPFVKVPTVGVGAGKIKLRTVGAFLSLNYNFIKE